MLKILKQRVVYSSGFQGLNILQYYVQNQQWYGLLRAEQKNLNWGVQ